MSSSANPVSRLVGREDELKEIHRILERAQSGKRQLLFLSGESGIGKTMLLETFLAELSEQREVRAISGHCVQHYGVGEAYLPLINAVSQLVRQSPDVVELLRREAPSWLAQMPGVIQGDELAVLQQRLRGVTRERMIRELAAALERVSDERCLVLVLEDLHWSDVSTIDWLSNVARRRTKARLMVLCTFRQAELSAANHPLKNLVRELSPRRLCSEILLKPLDESAINDYLAHAFELPVQSEEIPLRIRQRTEGNPLFMVHLIDFLSKRKALVERHGRLSLGEGLELLDYGVPDDLRQLIAEQIERLSEDDLAILEACSTVGVEFSCATAAAGAGLKEEEMERHCQRLAQQNLFIEESGVEESPDGSLSDRYRFRHVLYQNVLYDRIAEVRRVRMHRSIGEFRKGLFGEKSDRIAGELASHFGASQDSARTIEYYGLAGEKAMQRNALNEAIRHFEEALGLLPRLPEGEERDRLEVRYCIAVGAARMIREGHTSPQAKAYYGRAVTLAQDLKAHAELHLGYYGLHMFHFVSGEHQEALRLGIRCLENATQSGQARWITESHTAVGNVHTLCGDFSAALHNLETGLAAWDDQERGRTLYQSILDSRMVCMTYLARVYWYVGQPDRALELSNQCVAIARGLRHPHSLSFALFFSVLVLFRRGDYEEAYTRAAETVDYADEYQFPIWSDLGRVLLGAVAVQRGEVEWGMKLMKKGLRRREKSKALVGTCQTLCWLNGAYWISGDTKKALKVVVRALTLVETSGEHGYEAELIRQKGEFLLRQGGEEELESEVEALFEQAIQIAQGQGAVSWELRAVCSLARLWRKQGKVKPARDRLQKTYDRFDEGFSTMDLQMATRLIRELGGNAHEAGEVSTSVSLDLPGVVSPDVETEKPYRFKLEGDFWRIDFSGDSCHVKNSRGMEYLALLLGHPNEELHSLRLVQGDVSVDKAEAVPLELEAGNLSDAGELLDRRAKRAFRERLNELKLELEEARAFNDEGRIETLEEELDALTRALARATGLGGRSRKAGNPSERARINVTRAIKSALKNIAAGHPEAGKHLDRTVKTGNFCSYNPDPLAKIRWQTR